MSASRWKRSIITHRCTALISFANRSRTRRARKNETGRCLHRRPGGGDPGLAFAASRIRPAEDRVRPAMSHSLLFAFVIFATVMFFTPGPNNIMLLSSGLTYGFRPTIPHILGITCVFAVMIGAVAVGLGTVFIAYPVLQTILKYAGVAYLVYLAAAIAMSGPVSPDQDRYGRPWATLGAAMFTGVNVRPW